MNRISGLWLESLGDKPALATREELLRAIQFSSEAAISDIYLQVYREGRAWFPSLVAGQEHLNACLKAGLNPLQEILALASQRGIRVHAWINAFNLGLNTEAKILKDQGAELLLSDNCGVRIDRYTDTGRPPDSRAEYFQIDAPKLWLDPASVHVKQYLDTLGKELFSAYPEFSGLHLDFFRYPYFLPMQPSSRVACGYEFGYGQASIANFSKTLGNGTAFREDEKGALRPSNEDISLQWDRWRRTEIEEYLVRFRKLLPKNAVLSVAAIAWPDRAFFTAYQNWRSWLSQDLVDQVCLMAYTADDELFTFLIKQAAAFQGKNSALLAGAGVYLHSGVDQLTAQICAAEDCGAKGALIFSYENLRKRGITSSTLTDAISQRRRMKEKLS